MRFFSFKRFIPVSIVAAVFTGFGWYGHELHHHAHHQHHKHKLIRNSHYRFTSPLLDVEFPEGYDIFSTPSPFKHKIENLIKKGIDGGAVRNVSVYYRDLLDGPWIGINQNQEFNPASMMKVPLMISWLKRAQTNPMVLKQTFVFDGKINMSAMQSIKPAQTITAGRRYTIEELLVYMMKYSDNNATSLLYFNMDGKELDDVLTNMDVNNHPGNETNSISVVGYSGFFRILYNATYLNRDMSEKALELLSHEDFPQGFAAGAPKGTIIAAKFGEFEQGLHGAGRQLHEFGIVYHPKGPYILGVMTEGNDYTKQAEMIKDISALVYSENDSAPKNMGN